MKLIRKIIGVLGNTLVTTGEIGLVLFSLSFLWSVGKLEFFTVLALVAIITVIDKIKDKKPMAENKKAKFVMPLTWNNCETCPPKEFENESLYITDGTFVYCALWHRDKGWQMPFKDDDYVLLDQDELSFWYWADIDQTLRKCTELDAIRQKSN